MGNLLNGEKPLAFDHDGFMIDAAEWDEEIAEKIALLDGFNSLTPEQWRVIKCLRGEFQAHQMAPPIPAHVCFITHNEPHCLDTLFTSAKEAWRIAGLPNPGEEAQAYM